MAVETMVAMILDGDGDEDACGDDGDVDPSFGRKSLVPSAFAQSREHRR